MSEEKFSVKDGVMAAVGLVMLVGLGARLTGCSESSNEVANNEAVSSSEGKGSAPEATDGVVDAQASSSNEKPASSEWNKTEKYDAMENKNNISYTIGSPDKLHVSCTNGEISVFMDTRDIIDRDLIEGWKQRMPNFENNIDWNVKIRIDGGRIVEQKWNLSLRYDLIRPKNEEQFLKSLSGHDKLGMIIQGSSSKTYNISGADEVYAEMKKSCRK